MDNPRMLKIILPITVGSTFAMVLSDAGAAVSNMLVGGGMMMLVIYFIQWIFSLFEQNESIRKIDENGQLNRGHTSTIYRRDESTMSSLALANSVMLKKLSPDYLLKYLKTEGSSHTVTLVGIGCAGINSVDYLLKKSDYHAIVFDSDLQTLNRSRTKNRVFLGDRESIDAYTAQQSLTITKLFEGTDAVVIIAGLGGKTGSTISCMLARYLKRAGKMVHLFVITPFDIDGMKRKIISKMALDDLAKYADTVYELSNEEAYTSMGREIKLLSMFDDMNDHLSELVSEVLLEYKSSRHVVEVN
ncbi:MAG: hypothetical protein HON83_09780 [Candidatus Marinimicrobia bacterium]|jgi:hypothetical protein|nr:hypothetical protein [Candidatus Neomarinimicrobiota bacterium]MBT6929649.1 hypothetical protein [Candidatus Neomarinimicrobiota bacterium]